MLITTLMNKIHVTVWWMEEILLLMWMDEVHIIMLMGEIRTMLCVDGTGLQIMMIDWFFLLKAQSDLKVISERNTVLRIQRNLIHRSRHVSFPVWGGGLNEVEWTGKADIRKAYFVAAGKSRQSSQDDQLYKSGNLSELPEIIYSTQFCISDVKALMANNLP